MKYEDITVEKILGVDIKLLCNDGQERTISISDLLNVTKSDISISKDWSTPKFKLVLDLQCDNVCWSIKEDENFIYPEYIPEKYRMPDFMKPVEITCDTKNPYEIKSKIKTDGE